MKPQINIKQLKQPVIESLEKIFVSAIRQHKPSNSSLKAAMRLAKEKCSEHISGYKEKTPKIMPRLLTQEEIELFFKTLEPIQYRLMANLMYRTGIRVSELTNIKLKDVYPDENKIFIQRGKGNKDRYVVYPKKSSLTVQLVLNLAKEKKQVYLFETNRHNRYTRNYISKVFSDAGKEAGIAKRVYPHLLRHMFATEFMKHIKDQSKLAVQLGHKRRGTSDIYVHMAGVSPEELDW